MCPTVAAAPVEIGSRFRTIQSSTAGIPFDSGNTRSVELPRSFLYKALRCRLRGSIANAAGTATVNPESPFTLIKRIDLIADGRKVLMSLSGQDAYRLSNLFQGKAGEHLRPNAGVAATESFAGSFVLHNEAARMLSPIMSYFDPRPYEKVELRVQWGTIADMFLTPSTATVNAVTALDIQAVQSAEGAEQIAFNRLVTFDEFTFTGSVTNFTINVPRSGLLAGLLIKTLDASTAAMAPTNSFFQLATLGSEGTAGSITLKSDNNFLHIDSLNPTTLQNSNTLDYANDSGQTAAPANSTLVAGPSVAGYYYLDLTEDGLMTSLLNTFDLNVLQLILSSASSGVPNPTTLRVTYIFYEPITAA